MRFVLLALSRPLTVVVALIAVALASLLAVQRMPVDIFPQVGDPAIYVAQPYGGMDPAQMEGFLTYYYEYHFLYITGIDHVESKSIQGAALMKLVFHQGTDMASAMGETIGYVNRARAFMPPGTVPPFVTRFDAGSVAVGQLVFSSDNHTQGELQNMALNQVRPLFATLEGVSAPPPFGGNQRSIVVTLDPDKLQPVSDLSRRSDCGREQRDSRHAFRQHVDRRNQPDCANQRDARRQSGGIAEHADSSCIRNDDLSPRYRHDRKRHRHHHRLRARQWQAHGIHSRHQARRRFDACCHRSRQDSDTRSSRLPFRKTSMSGWNSISPVMSPRPFEILRPKVCSGRC